MKADAYGALARSDILREYEAAYASGFQSIPHFNRVFKKYTGVSPTEHRAHLRA